MFIITFENEVNRQWHCHFHFDTHQDAENYLRHLGFVNKNRIYVKPKTAWSSPQKAYIEPLKPFNPNRELPPYSPEDYEEAKKQGLDLDNWEDYKQFCGMEEYAEEDERFIRRG